MSRESLSRLFYFIKKKLYLEDWLLILIDINFLDLFNALIMGSLEFMTLDFVHEGLCSTTDHTKDPLIACGVRDYKISGSKSLVIVY